MATHWASARRPGTATRSRIPPKAQSSPKQASPPNPLHPNASLGPKITPWTEYHIARGLEELRKIRSQRETEVQSTRSATSTATSNLSYTSLLSTQSAPTPPVASLIKPLPLAEVLDSRASSSSLPNEFRRLEVARKSRSRLKPLPKRPPLSGPTDDQGERRQRVEFMRKLYTNQVEGPQGAQSQDQSKPTTSTPSLEDLETTMSARSPLPKPSPSPHTSLKPLARPLPSFPHTPDSDTGTIGLCSPSLRVPHLLPSLPHANPLTVQSPLLRSPVSRFPEEDGTTLRASGRWPAELRAREINGSVAPSPKVNSTLGEDDVESLIQWTQQLDLRDSWAF
eukprot:GGOE01003815.1.p1 GENE.GGOE01003815.1~~GGOE01003815.1.p1  ORF type:complete len:338 (+),score=26.55 GGOE01003815.1:89-1102(+)